MSTPTRVSRKGLEFIGSFEGMKLTAYRLPGESFYTIGFGHYGPDVRANQRITRDQAFDLLREDTHRFEQAVVKHVPKRFRTKQWQFDALVSIAFNLGEGVLTAAPPLTSLGQALQAKLPTKRNKDRIAAAMKLYDKDSRGIALAGLTRRRRAEARLYRTDNYSTEA